MNPLCQEAHVIPVRGNITESNLGDFRIALDRATNASEKDVRLDLSGAENLAGPALGLIARASRHLAKDGRRLHIHFGNNNEELLQPVSHLIVG